MSVYQQIKDKFIMKNAYKDWASYRSELTEIILEMNPQSVMIIGAGRCNDIDLYEISSETEKVICIDVDEDSVNDAIEKLPENLREKIEYKCVSLTGIYEDDMEEFCENLLDFARREGGGITSENFRTRMIQCIDVLKSKMIRNEEELLKLIPEASVDVLICSGVYSQMFSTLLFFIRSLVNSLYGIITNVNDLESEAEKMICDMNDRVIPIINSALSRAARKKVIFGNEYNPESPVEGAVQCISYVREYMNPFETHLKWYFNRAEGIVYDMLIQVCSK